MDLFKRIFELIGEQVDGEVYQDFVRDLKEAPMGARSLYFFPESGFSMITVQRVFVRAFLNVCTPRDPGYINPFKGELVGGILPTDNRDAVRTKLAGKLVQSDETEDQFDCSPLIFFVKFSDDGQQICSLSLGYRDDGLPDGLSPEIIEETGQYGMSLNRPVRKRVGPRHRPQRER